MPHFTAALPLGRLAAGERFAMSDWPLHVTLLSPFAIGADAATVTRALSGVAPPQALPVTAGDDWFGPGQKTLVTLVEHSDELRAFHDNAVDAVRALGADFRIPGHLGDGYRPHVTVQRTGRVHQGDSFVLAQLALAELYPEDGAAERAIRSVFPLAAHN